MKTLILAGGYGTRLYPTTLNIPKALLDIGKRKLIDFILAKCFECGIKDISVITNDRFYSMLVEWRNSSKEYSSIEIINDKTSSPENRLGAVGDLELFLDHVSKDEDILVIGSDNIFDWRLDEFIKFSLEKKSPVVGLYDLENIQDAGRFGVVEIDGKNKVTNLEEKPGVPKTSLIATCIYYFPAKSFGLIKKYLAEKNDRDTSGMYIKWLSGKTDVYGYIFRGLWLDIGHKNSLEKAVMIFGKDL